MNKKGLIGIVVVVGVLLVVGFFWFVGELNGEGGEVVCVPASCCHSTGCVLSEDAPDCGEILCTMSCEPETLDCGQGHCEFVDGECEVVWDE